MKFRCQHCQAKYSIPDEKVRNKLLRIRCKKCKNLIEVSEASAADEPASGMTMPVAPVAGGKARAPGTGLLTGKTGPAPAPPPLPSVSRIVAQPPAIPDLAWFIGHKGKQEGPLSGPQLTERIMKGQLRPQMLAWREGMADWRRLDQVPELNAWLRHAESPKRPSAVPRSAPPAPPSSAGRAAGARAPASSPGSRRDSRKPLDPGGKLAPSPAAGAPARSAAGARSSLDDRLAAILGPVSKPAPAGRTAGKDRPAAAGGGSAAPAQAAQGDLDVAGTLPDTV